ncbi:hypothetical protein EDD65_102171 [Keratinibaculum paraultunense]|uniref:Uncharacterized protein n=1 Tax=Keratinibaculum paraultunense TaxID=1278232 RepID=A0A4R3KZJ9_9FIRM|nr:hypothetical protein [Keratinibaculum paraultunense]QQY80517.1 hypothetical protein JL105_04230 [Keratinibaculum paraultunense]TCS91239.1 hypothetical protein EDD65_102171 [Keratinibaculum paraultunense]
MENNQSFEQIKEKFKAADVDEKIEIYTTVRGLTVEQYKELLRMFPIKYLDKLEKAMG